VVSDDLMIKGMPGFVTSTACALLQATLDQATSHYKTLPYEADASQELEQLRLATEVGAAVGACVCGYAGACRHVCTCAYS